MTGLRIPQILFVRVRDLRPWSGNPKTHEQEQLDRLARSLDRFGLARIPVVQKGTLRILAGHGLHMSLMDAGHGDAVVPVVALELDDDEAAAYTLADNRLAELSEWNVLDLRDQLGELDDGARDMLALGWSDAELLALFGKPIEVPDGVAGVDEEIPEGYLVELVGEKARVSGPDKKKAKRLQAALEAAGWGKA